MAPVYGVAVTLTTAASSLTRNAITNSQGDFTITGLSVAGDYTIAAAKEGFALAKQTGIALESGATANIRIQLNVAGVRTPITVTGVPGAETPVQPLTVPLLMA